MNPKYNFTEPSELDDFFRNEWCFGGFQYGMEYIKEGEEAFQELYTQVFGMIAADDQDYAAPTFKSPVPFYAYYKKYDSGRGFPQCRGKRLGTMRSSWNEKVRKLTEFLYSLDQRVAREGQSHTQTKAEAEAVPNTQGKSNRRNKRRRAQKRARLLTPQ